MPLKYYFGFALWAATLLLVAGLLDWITPTRLLIAATAAALALLATAAAWFLRQLDQRLTEMSKATDQIAAGVSWVQSEVPQKNEVATLNERFTHMSETIRNRLGELQASIQQHRAIAEHGPDAMWVFHVEAFQLVDVNENFVRLSGYPREELIGATPMAVSAPVQADGTPTEPYARQVIQRMLGGEKVIVPWMIRHKDGRDIPCELRGLYLPAPGRTLVCGSLMDVSKRLQAEAALSYHRRFESLITRLSTRMIGLRLGQVDEGINGALSELGQFAEVDRAYVFAFDDSRERVSCVYEWCAENIAPQIRRLQSLKVSDFSWVAQRLLRDEVVHVPNVCELPADAAAERAEWLAESIKSLLLVPMNLGGKGVGYVGFDSVRAEKNWNPESIALLKIFGEMIINVMQRRQTEEALRTQAATLEQSNEELARSNEDLQQFAYAASHDLQEPLRAISGFSSLLAQRYHGRFDAGADQDIRFITDSATRLQRMISDMLEYSRIDHHARPFSRCSTGLSLKQALENLNNSIKELGAEIQHDPLPDVMGDPSQLMQLFQNLIGNAIKFHGSAPPRVRVRVEAEGNSFRFSVQDNGIGIPDLEHQRVFQVFRRLHSSEHYPGSGVGLAVCKRIVERHRGRIWIEPNQGGGSVFCFTMPAADGVGPV